MIRFLTTFYRSAKNNPRIFLINIVGFSIGIVSAMFIYIYVAKEYKTDRFHKKHRDIYRVVQNLNGADLKSTTTFYPLGDLLEKNFGAIRNYTRYQEGGLSEVFIGNKKLTSQEISYVDRSFFEMFDFKTDVGDYNEIFNAPDKVLISVEVAYKFFNTIDAIGKTFEAQSPMGPEIKTYTVSGILSEYPEESTVQLQIVADIKSEESRYANRLWTIRSPQLFLYIPDSDEAEKIAPKISEKVVEKVNTIYSGYGRNLGPNAYELQNLTDLYLGSAQINDALPKGDKRLAKILLLIGIVLISITFVNAIISNLGLVLKDKKNTQIHNVLGCSRGWLKRKIISENILYSILAFGLSLLLYPLVYKIITSFSDYRYSLLSKSDFLILSSFLSILILFGVLSGLVQYIFIRKNFNQRFGGLQFGARKTVFNRLVQFQMMVFMVATISLFFIVRQVKHIQNMEMGFDVDNTFLFKTGGEMDENLFKQEFEKYPFVNSISLGEQLYKKQYRSFEIKITETGNTIDAQFIQGDADYLKTYKIKLLEGNDMDKDKIPVGEEIYNRERQTNTIADVLVSEEFVKRSGLENPVGTLIEGGGIYKGQIVGIFQDVKNLPVYQTIKPTVIAFDIGGLSSGLNISIKDGTLEQFKTAAKLFYNERNVEIGDNFDWRFWQYDFWQEYQKEQVFSKLIVVFTVIILCILLLGLIGLSLFITESKTKEIGIRKINGAKVSEILTMLNKDFVKWVVIAFMIATPVSYYAMNKWLENFAYKTELNWWIFALAGLLALGIALLTVSWQSWKAATRNPVEALRYE